MTTTMRILPVLDLCGGQVVHALRGERARYQPLITTLAAGSDPGVIGRALRDTFSFNAIYVADLDAIAGRDPNWRGIGELLEIGFAVWLDPGVTNTTTANRWAEFEHSGLPLSTVVIGLESVRSRHELSAIVDAVSQRRAVFSLDLIGGRPILGDATWSNASPLKIVREAVESGFRRVIVLDLSAVGAEQGLQTTELCREILAEFPALELTTGGGVRNLEDIELVARVGCQGLLLASALHQGALCRKDLDRYC